MKAGFFMDAYISAGCYFLVTTAGILIAILIFDLITKYKIWEEITKGNLAVSFATSGIILGVANIMQSAIRSR